MPSPRNKRVTIAKGAGLRKFLLGDSLGSKPILKKLLVFLLDQRDIIMGVVRGAISAVEVIAPNGVKALLLRSSGRGGLRPQGWSDE